MSRRISDLTVDTQEKCRAFIAACLIEQIDILITSTLRSRDEQARLYAQGRTTPGRIVTNAKPGESLHETGHAFDFVPMKNGKAIWDDDALWLRCGVIAENVGLEWAGRWKHFREMAHCQMRADS